MATGSDYTTKLSEAGGSDRLAILLNAGRLTSEPYSGGTSGLVDRLKVQLARLRKED